MMWVAEEIGEKRGGAGPLLSGAGQGVLAWGELGRRAYGLMMVMDDPVLSPSGSVLAAGS